MSVMQGTIAATGRAQRAAGLMSQIGAFWHDLFRAVFDSYRPELHYMRGPGPACAKRGKR